MTASADRFRLLVGVTLGGVLAASCIQIEDASDKKKAVADVFWVLLNSTEFLFNH